MWTRILAAATPMLLSAAAFAQQPSSPESAPVTEAVIPTLAVGQVWHYRARAGEEQSTATVVRLDTLPKIGVVVHVSFAGVRIKNPHISEGYSSTITHAPFTESSVRSSLTRLVRAHAPLPDFEEGYDTWRKAYESGTGGVFTISLAEAVEFMERALAQ